MKNLFLSALLIAGISSYAQEKPALENKKQRTERISPEKRTELRLQKMTAELDLSPTQQQELSKLFAERNAKHAEFKKQRKAAKPQAGKISDEQKAEFRKKRQADQQVHDQRIKSILNPAQAEKWEQLKAERKDVAMKHKARKAGKSPHRKEIKK